MILLHLFVVAQTTPPYPYLSELFIQAGGLSQAGLKEEGGEISVLYFF
jgi:hypothetical protein